MRPLSIPWLTLATLTCACGAGYAMLHAASRRPLVVTEYPSPVPGPRLGVVLASDGAVAPARELGRALSHGGLPTLTIVGRARAVTPTSIAAKVDSLIRDSDRHLRRPRLVLIGLEGGAGMAPFVANRLDVELRASIDLLFLSGLSLRVGFQERSPGWISLGTPSTGLPVLPELERLRGIPIACGISSARPSEDVCTSISGGLIRHRLLLGPASRGRSSEIMAQEILQLLSALRQP